ncbi:adenosylcobinamide-phosphate synthase CbiB [Prochlorococcus sp. MIT 0602]|uniref:adenosylcobinamide-phosphate synthase CbiB n=1 Tax=Prochlorococcus sp. MIT 0602 TaxID=1499499 RepID=UPI0009077427|nr:MULTISPECIES: adenosylcobinamide-phosphate synthase CbiB [unclassified Prochlorococcus]
MTLLLGAVLIDLLIGDPRFIPHPVEIIGCLISFLRKKVEFFAGGNTFYLRVGGALITFLVTGLSTLCCWFLEQLFFLNSSLMPRQIIFLILILALASSLASKSLFISAFNIINALNESDSIDHIQRARKKLTHIVGRDVENLDRQEILRATAESISENAIDGIFAPLFWMMIGMLLWKLSPVFPGPLSMVWFFKSSSTIDSMIGYKEGNLLWLGQAGARLDDTLTFLPCRLVLITLPFISHSFSKAQSLIKMAWIDGSKDLSPNSGISEAIFAHCAGIRMGGMNTYKGKNVFKPLLAKNAPKANIKSIKKVINLSLKLQIVWVSVFSTLYLVLA